MKKNAMMMAVCLALTLPASAQSWNKWDTRSTISGVLGIASAAIESAERKKEMEILALPEATLCPHLPHPARGCQGVRPHRAIQHVEVQGHQVSVKATHQIK